MYLFGERPLSRKQFVGIAFAAVAGFALIISEALLWILLGAANPLEERTYLAGIATGGQLMLLAGCYEDWIRRKLPAIWLIGAISAVVLPVVWWPVVVAYWQQILAGLMIVFIIGDLLEKVHRNRLWGSVVTVAAVIGWCVFLQFAPNWAVVTVFILGLLALWLLRDRKD